MLIVLLTQHFEVALLSTLYADVKEPVPDRIRNRTV